MPRHVATLNLAAVVSVPVTPRPPSKRRRIGWWILLGVLFGSVLTVGVLSLPPVQAWILRRALATQPDTAMDFSRFTFGPRGAEATDVKLRLPNLTVEARALRLAISPWQLLSRRRLAIADLQAKQIAVQATPSTDESTTPFEGILDSFQAPLAWACDRAEADGVITLLQPGSPAIPVSFQLTGASLDMARPGQLHFDFSAPGELVADFKGPWKFKGTLDFVPGANGRIDSLTVNGTLTPALSETLRLPAVAVRFATVRTPLGEHYEVSLKPAGIEQGFTFSSSADFKKATGTLTGEWDVRGESSLAALLLKRTDLPLITASNHGKFSLNTRTGDADASTTGEFTGSDWQRFEPSLAAIGQLKGVNTAQLGRRNNTWSLVKLDAKADSDGSDAALRLTLTRLVALPPGNDGNAQPWGKLTLEKFPLGWAASTLGVAQLSSDGFSGSWSITSPNASTLRFESLGKIATTNLRFEHSSLPKDKIPPLSVGMTSRLTLTAEEAHVELPEISIESAKADRFDATVDARVKIDSLKGAVTASWRSHLPTWLGGEQAPRLRGSITADLDTETAAVRALRVEAIHDQANETAFALELLTPFKLNFENPAAVETTEGDVLKFTARNLHLDWAAPLLPGFTLSGVVAQGSSTLRREGREFLVATSTPWTLQNLSVVQGGVPLVRASEFTAAPEGRVQLNADWTPGDFLGSVKLSGRIAEVFGLRDPAGEFSAEGRATGSRRGEVLELREFSLAVNQHDGAPLLEVATLQPAVLGKTAKTNNIEQAPDWLRIRSRAIPLAWLQPFLPEGMSARGTLEPTEFALKMELPNAMLRAAKPVALTIDELRDESGPLLRDTRVDFVPGVFVIGMFAALGVEDLHISMQGRQTGSGGANLLYLTSRLTLPMSTQIDFSHEVAALRAQPGAATMALPTAGTARFIYQHDLSASKKPTGTFLLQQVPTADGSGMLPPLGIRVTQLDSQDPANPRFKMEFQYQTTPTWSQFNAEFSGRMREKVADISTTLSGEFFDLGQFMRLVDACVPATPALGITPKKSAAAPTAPSAAPVTETLAGPFWQTLRAKFDLDFTKLVYADYQIDQLTGQLTVDEEGIQLRKLTGKMFDGEWSGNFRMDYDWKNAATPYGFTGGFKIKDFSATKIVQAAYPNELGSFDVRLNFLSEISSRTWSPLDAIDQSTARFEFGSSEGRLKLNVPYANVASAGLLVGGAITFSPELRALGRLIRKFSDLPVDTLSGKGQRAADGTITLESFQLGTPQLRLVAHGSIPFQKDKELAARPFELPVTLSAKDEIAVIMRGMKLLEKKPDAEGFYAMTRKPALRGTIGEPDTTELYDTFAQAVDASSGTFGFLMKKVLKEVEKAQAAEAKK
ncbi:hypothetical protein [Oleiharenicola lentus]|uniref:hypothetical protein n=1 Tax=Oleiharenicola lentus TaxID=2508720 RepID=UPI003F67DAAB